MPTDAHGHVQLRLLKPNYPRPRLTGLPFGCGLRRRQALVAGDEIVGVHFERDVQVVVMDAHHIDILQDLDLEQRPPAPNQGILTDRLLQRVEQPVDPVPKIE